MAVTPKTITIENILGELIKSGVFFFLFSLLIGMLTPHMNRGGQSFLSNLLAEHFATNTYTIIFVLVLFIASTITLLVRYEGGGTAVTALYNWSVLYPYDAAVKMASAYIAALLGLAASVFFLGGSQAKILYFLKTAGMTTLVTVGFSCVLRFVLTGDLGCLHVKLISKPHRATHMFITLLIMVGLAAIIYFEFVRKYMR